MNGRRTRAIIVNDALCSGRVADGIGKAYLIRELRRGVSEFDIKNPLQSFVDGTKKGFHNFGVGWKGKKEVLQTVVDNGAKGEAMGLRRFYEVLMSVGLGQQDEMREFALEYIKE